MTTPNTDHPADAARHAGVKIYDRPGTMALALRPMSLILVALLAIVAASLVYYKYYSA